MQRKDVLRIGFMAALGIAVFLKNVSAHAQASGAVESLGQKERGFALSAGVATTPFALDKSLVGFTTFSGAFGLGYKIDRVVIGGTFDFSRYATVDQADDGMGNSIVVAQAVYSFVIGPDVQVALARSADRRAELIGGASVLLGTWNSETTTSSAPNPPPDPNDPTRFTLRWRLAPGVRYWMHPNIAFSALVGVTGTHQILDSTNANLNRSSALSTVYTQFGLTGVF